MVTRTDFNQYMMPTYKPAEFIPAKAKGSLLWDKKNKTYIDFASGIAVSSLGHCHPTLNKALADQSKKIWHLSNLLTNEPALRLAKIFCKHTFAEKVFSLSQIVCHLSSTALKLYLCTKIRLNI